MTGILRGLKDEINVSVVAEIQGQKIPFTVVYRRRDYDDAMEVLQQIKREARDDDIVGEPYLKEILLTDIIRWEKLQGEGGEVEFNPENLAAALQRYGYRMAMYQGWNAAQNDRKQVNAKN